jgi:hypothetical protein
MVTLTERAGVLLHELQEAEGLTEPPRIVPQAGQLTLSRSPAEPQDEILYHEETPVLRLAPEAAAALVGCTITTRETPDGVQLAVVSGQSPNGRVDDDEP